MMALPPTGISERDWEAAPLSVQALVEQLSAQLIALTARVAQLDEQKGRSFCNSSQPSSSDGPGLRPPSKEKVSGLPDVNYVGGFVQLRWRVALPSPCHGRGWRRCEAAAVGG